MPRALIFGNGRLFVAFDDRGRIRELCWPLPGQWNHLNGRAVSYGIWIDGEYSWLDSPEWQVRIQPAEPQIQAQNDRLGVRVSRTIRSSGSEDLLVDCWLITDLRGESRSGKVFCTETAQINESDVGDTTLFYEPKGIMAHTKHQVAIGFGGRSDEGGISDYASGMIGFGGTEGTWRDCEDGSLSMKAIEQGTVDCSFGVPFSIDPENETQLTLWISLATEVAQLSAEPPSIPAKHLAPDLMEVSKQVMLNHCCESGAILAAIDSDIMTTNRANYAYCWPRDAAEIAATLWHLGEREPAIKLLEWSSPILSQNGFFFQKYLADGTLGATWHPWVWHGEPILPVQTDETAAVVSLALECGAESWLANHEKAIQWLASQVNGETGLHLPCFDLWEERYGVHFYTQCKLIQLAELLSGTERWQDLGTKMELKLRQGWERFWLEDGRIARAFIDGEPDFTADSAVLAGLLAVDAPASQFERALAYLEPRLKIRSSAGGYARLDGDYYHRRYDHHPGNPWIISTLWFGWAREKVGESSGLEQALNWCENVAGTIMMLPEQIDPETGEFLSVSPLAWSHSEYAKAKLYLGPVGT